MNPPTIETDNLILRPFTPDDADAYYAAVLSSEAIMRVLPTGRPVPPQRARAIIGNYIDSWAEAGYGLWIVILRDSGQIIGHCGFQPLDQKVSVELTYAFQPSHASGGLPVEAARACLRYAFETLGIIDVVAVILPGNNAARRVYKRLGLRLQGKTHAYNQHLPFYLMNQGDFVLDESRYVVTGENDESAHD